MSQISLVNKRLFAGLLLLVPFAAATQTPKDSTHLQPLSQQKSRSLFPENITARTYLFPAALVTFGAAATIIRENKNNRGDRLPHSPARETSIFLEPENYTALAPAAAVAGLQVMGIKGMHRPQEQALLYAMAAGISTAIVYPLKNNTRVLRPDKSDAQAFPSGHASLAFASAEFLRREYGRQSVWYTVGGYAAAMATAVLRVAKKQHRVADVSAGAGIGIASTTTAYWIYNKLKKRPRRNPDQTTLFMPAVSPGYYGVYITKRL
ncbi:phosphatase PAP2 family protein [Niabella aurantiaca]|uniref:phosphatase PAP2 family protein n=1 Tax=Niabella aurantiaca TaxID=379900 RepID=UPI00039AC335|nr:phosphatase PAP2 family protein [Niabella aurantiaca]